MTKVLLGKTGILVNKDGFGALPVQRANIEEASRILNAALDGGIDFFDTARGYTDSEEKIGRAISGRRQEFILATKTPANNAEGFWKDLETSLSNLKTGHIDIYQFHNPAKMPRPDDGTGLYEAALKAQEQGKIRFIGITNHRLAVALEAVESGLYSSLQFPFNYLSDSKEEALVKTCAEKGLAFIAMKALSGGLITDIGAAHAYIAGFGNVVPIWGIQRLTELEMLLEVMNEPHSVGLTTERKERIEKDRAALSGAFCRGCGYCLPCPAEIVINMCARMTLFMNRAPSEQFYTEHWQKEMAKIADCRRCNHCKKHCPYELDTPELLAKNYEEYKKTLQKAGITAIN